MQEQFVTYEISGNGGWKIHKANKVGPIIIDTKLSYYQGREQALQEALKLI